MITEKEFNKYAIFDNKLSMKARSYIEMVRCSEPSRMVGTHAKSNVCSWSLSKKIGRTVSIESDGPEDAFFILCEYDKEVLEIWDQPEPVRIVKSDINGRRRSQLYTPDFLLLTRSGPEVIEVKPTDKIEELIEKYPSDWLRLESGEVKYLPAERRFSELGLKFRVFEYSHEKRYLIANISMLLQVRNELPVSEEIIDKTNRLLKESFSWTLGDLKKRLRLESVTTLIQMVDIGVLKVCLDKDLLSLPESCIVASNYELLDQARDLVSKNKIYLDGMVNKTARTKFPSEKEAISALNRLEKIEQGKSGRDIRRWKERIREGAKGGLSKFQSLLPSYFNSGNNNRKINKVVEDFLMDYLLEVHSKKQGLSLYRSYINYKVSASDAHSFYNPVTRKTFTNRLRQIPADVIAFQRGGKRAANAASDPTDPLKRSLKAQVAWERAAIDHYLADIYLIYFSRDGEVHVERPWVTAMIDLYSSSVLALSISFLSPSRRSVAKVMRECVRKHGKLPRGIIVDRGSDFRSVYFASLLAHFGIKYILRPASYSQYGGEVEGLFGEFKKQWLTQREGNLADYKEARSVDGKKAPKKSAVLKPEDFYREINAFSSWRDNKCRGPHEMSASARFNQSQKNFPFISESVNYDSDFLLATSVESNQYTVDFQRGIHIREFWYYTPEIGKVRGKKSKLEVRIDPENPHVIFALIDNQWCPCYSSEINSYSAKSPIMQMVEGLTKYEASKNKQNIREQDDFDLVRVIREMDELAKADSIVPIVEIDDHGNEGGCGNSIFDQLKNADIKPYKRESWG